MNHPSNYQTASAGARILVVEDEAVTAMYIEELLTGMGYAVVGTAGTGEEAVRQASSLHPDVVLMDIMLQGEMDGIDAAHRLREQAPASAVIYLTAAADAPILERAKQTRPFGYILKPFEERDLYSNIEMALYKSHMERELETSREKERAIVERNTELVEQLTSILRSLGDGVFGIDADGKAIFANPALERITGWSSAELIGRNTHDLIHHTRPDGTDYPGEHCPIRRTLRDGRTRNVGEDVFWRKNGEAFPVEYTVSSMHNGTGEPTGAVIAVRDITERKRIEDELRRHQENLEHIVAERTRELESFSYTVSHDLRAPLRAINGFSQALMEDCADALDETGSHYLERIRAATTRMAQLIEGLLTLSRIIRRDLESVPVDLSAAAGEVAAALREADPEREARFEIQAGLCAKGDPTLLRLLLENLMGNAWKFTAQREPARIAFGQAEHKGRNAFFVSDNGIGFDGSQVTGLFQPFQRLANAQEYDGTGIGLATVYRIVKRHGGECWADGEIDQGAYIYFTLS